VFVLQDIAIAKTEGVEVKVFLSSCKENNNCLIMSAIGLDWFEDTK
jgi:hypothetical protein